jgi:sugar lactone lactonase YvrE
MLAVMAVVGVLVVRIADGSFVGKVADQFGTAQVPPVATAGATQEAPPAFDAPSAPVGGVPSSSIQRFEAAAPSAGVPVIPSGGGAAADVSAGSDNPQASMQTVATVEAPSYPAPVALDRSHDIWVGTDSASRPSRIFHYSPSGALVGAITIDAVGVAALAFAPDGRLYAALRGSAAIVSVDTKSGDVHSVATLPDVSPCIPVALAASCDSRLPPSSPMPSALAFDRGGNLYVGDAGQAAVWRVPAGGGAPVWFAGDSTWSNPAAGTGVSGVAVDARGNLLVVVDAVQATGEGAVDAITVSSGGSAGARRRFATFPAGALPSAIALGRSGATYVSLSGAGNIAVLDPTGARTRSVPDQALDTPRGVALRNGALYVAVQSLGKPTAGAVVSIALDDAPVAFS